MDSGASALFLPDSYRLLTTVTIPGWVRRVVGLGGMVNYGKRLHPDFRLLDVKGRLGFCDDPMCHHRATHGRPNRASGCGGAEMHAHDPLGVTPDMLEQIGRVP
jgi:hypothetical protein